MDMSIDTLHAASIRRIRQACANCRRKKTKCSGERPICFHCRRNRLVCVYEPYSATVCGVNPTAPMLTTTISNNPNNLTNPNNLNNLNNTELLNRIATIESRLAELSEQSASFRGNLIANPDLNGAQKVLQTGHTPDALRFTPLASSPIDHSTFPPPPVLNSLIDTYFEHVHNQPYSYFQEASFRQKLEAHSLPRCLVLAVLSFAVRFSTHPYYNGRTHDASNNYSRESWLSVLTEHLSVEVSLNVHVVQTVNLLAVVDYTAGRVSSGWLKVGLAARISQDLHLMTEPHTWLPYTEQEEHRRAFWSAYLIDKLISCGRSRPLVILDADCTVQLPCDEQTFNKGEWKQTNTLDELLNWKSELVESPSGFALVLLMASILGRCTRYVYHNIKTNDIPPWDTKSEFAAINSSLLLLESYSKIGTWGVAKIIRQEGQDQRQIGHLIFAHALFHLCHCLLNHPFLVRLRLSPFGSKAPASFSIRALETGCDHAKGLMDLLLEATESGCRIESSFYAYCIAVAGGIHSLASHFEHQSETRRQSDSLHYYNQCLEALESLAKLWVHASNMVVRLREFHSISHRFSSLLDPMCLGQDLNTSSEEFCWSMIDYAILGAEPHKEPLTSNSATSNLPSPNSLSLGPHVLSTPPSRFDAQNSNISDGLSPTMRLNEVDYFLNYSPGTNELA